MHGYTKRDMCTIVETSQLLDPAQINELSIELTILQ